MPAFFRPPRFLLRDRGATRTQTPQHREVICYRCARSASVSGFAESASCPHCAGNLRLSPIEIRKGHWGNSIMTTESVVVREHAKVIANLIVASHDILIEGVVHGMCICGGVARISPTGELKGGIRSTQLIIDAGATIDSSIIEAPSSALGTVDVDAATRARPGTGPAAQIEFKHLEVKCKVEPPEKDTIFIDPAHQPRLRVVRS